MVLIFAGLLASDKYIKDAWNVSFPIIETFFANILGVFYL